MNLYEGINSNLKEQTYTIKQTAGNFGTYSLCDWKAESPEKAIEEFIEKNPEFKDNKKGHITAVAKTIKEADDKKCVLCGKHFREWGNDPWPLADEGWCCDKCNTDKVVPARIALAYKKEESKTEEKKEAEYGDGARHYSNALISLCEQGIVSWENVAHGLINYCSEDDIKDFCDSYQYTDLIDNPTGEDSLEDAEEPKDTFVSPAKDYPDYVKEKLANKEDATTWYCDSCHKYFEEPESKSTDMENYYGVGSDFPDHHYKNLLLCPLCGSDDIEEQNIFFDSIVDEFLDDPKGSELVYEEISKRRPELIKTSDTTLEDLIDEPEILDIVAENI